MQQLDSSGANVTHIKKHQQEQVLLASLCPLLSVTNVPSENEPPAK